MATGRTKPPSEARGEPTRLDARRSRRDRQGRPTAGGRASVRRRHAPGISGRRWTKQPTRRSTVPGVPGVSARHAPASSTLLSHPATAGCRAIRTCVVAHRGRPAATRRVARVAPPVAAAASTPTSPSSHTNPLGPLRPPSHVAGQCRTRHPVPPRHTIRSRRSGIAARPERTSRATNPRRAPVDRANPQPTPGITTLGTSNRLAGLGGSPAVGRTPESRWPSSRAAPRRSRARPAAPVRHEPEPQAPTRRR